MKYRLKKKNILILCGILVGIVLLNYAYTYAKYVANSTWNYYLQSKEFFFSSDSLDSEGFKNVNTTWDGNKTTFNIKNSISLDKITDYDIKYDVSCEVLQGDGAKCLMNGTGTNTFSGTLSSNQMCINKTDDNQEVKYEIADVMNYCILLCHQIGVNPKQIILDKMEISAQKYPVEKAKGVSTKYNKL